MAPAISGDDFVQPFQVQEGPVRGRLIRLGAVVDTIVRRQDYPEAVATLLGEMLIMTSAIAGTHKFDGICTLQTNSDGPVSLLVADLASPGELRGYARFDRAAVARAQRDGGDSGNPVPRLLGSGHLVFTVDQGPETERYQGYVGLEGATLADCAHNYFRQSEQFQASLRMAVDRVEEDGEVRWRAGGIMVQRLPESGAGVLSAEEEPEDSWRQALALVGTATDGELTDAGLAPESVLYRLFHEMGVRVFRPHPLVVGCRCSRERIERVLGSFRPKEIADMVVDGRIVVTCEFCNTAFPFSEAEVARLSKP